MNVYAEYGIIYTYMEYNSALKRGGILLDILSWVDGFENIMLCVKFSVKGKCFIHSFI